MKTKAIKWLNSKIADETTKAELDIIEFIKKCVNSFAIEPKNQEKEDYIKELFDKFYKIYKRKGARVQAYKTWRKKLVKLKTKDQILEKARAIAKVYAVSAREWEERETEKQFIPLCSSFLNSNVPD